MRVCNLDLENFEWVDSCCILEVRLNLSVDHISCIVITVGAHHLEGFFIRLLTCSHLDEGIPVEEAVDILTIQIIIHRKVVS